MRSYCSFVAWASGRSSPRLARERERDAAVFGGVRRGEKAAVLAVLHVFAIGFEHARVRAGLRKTSRSIVRSRPSAAPSARPSARPAVLMFITMLTSAFTLAAWPDLPDIAHD